MQEPVRADLANEPEPASGDLFRHPEASLSQFFLGPVAEDFLEYAVDPGEDQVALDDPFLGLRTLRYFDLKTFKVAGICYGEGDATGEMDAEVQVVLKVFREHDLIDCENAEHVFFELYAQNESFFRIGQHVWAPDLHQALFQRIFFVG